MNPATAAIYLPYKLTLRSPAVVTTLSGDPDSAATQPFIPGASIRGAMAARLIASGVGGGSEEFRRLILSGPVRYLHAYPELGGARALPAPSSWQGKKDDPYQAFDLAAFSGEMAPDDDERRWPEDSLSRLPSAFVAASFSAGVREVATPRISARLHQQRDRVKGRPWTDQDEQRHGTIFAYEFLEADQVFCGVIQVMPEASKEVERIKSLLGSAPILVGRSRRAGYGGEAEVAFQPKAVREYESASGSLSGDIPEGCRFRVLLTSSYVGRHPATGQIDPAALDGEVYRRLDGAVTIERKRLGFEIVGGFNRTWRLALPQAPAVAAGGVLVLKATRSIPEKTLRDIEHHGLGERRVEGLGRILFLQHDEAEDASTEDAIRLGTGSPTAQPTAPRPLSESDRAQIAALERRIVLAAARAELDGIASKDIASKTKSRPTSSLLGRLRTVFRSVVNEPTAQAALEQLGAWCGSDERAALKRPAREQLEKCSPLPGGNLLTWLAALAAVRTGEQGWQALKQAVGGSAPRLNKLAQSRHLTSPQTADAQLHAHAAQLTVHLIDGVLAAMSRLNRRGE